MTTTTTPMIRLIPAEPHQLGEFTRRVQAAFAPAVEQEMGRHSSEPIPSDEEVTASFDDPRAEVLQVFADGVRVGGAVVLIDADTHHNELELFFIDLGTEGRGFGRHVWRAIEESYPDTRVWSTVTPHFEVRNIHFYINVCGFHATEFFHAGHPDPHEQLAGRASEEFDVTDRAFRFEKRMPLGRQ